MKRYKLDKNIVMSKTEKSKKEEASLVAPPDKPKQVDMRMPFGKHGPKDGKPGTLICDLPDSYLIWILDQDWLYKKFPKLAEQIVIEHKYRNRWKR